MHSKFPWTTHSHTPTAVFDGDGRRIIDQWVAPEGWQDIETAPRDGRLAIVYRPLAHMSGDQPVAVKRLVEVNHFCWPTTVPEGSEPNNPTADGSCHVTHWMPLPAPPSDAPAPTPLDPETAAANAVMIAGLPGLIEAAEAICWEKSSTFKSKNGREVGIEADDGEKCWIVHSDEITALEAALAALASIGRTL